jgi:cold shock CspA family protein
MNANEATGQISTFVSASGWGYIMSTGPGVERFWFHISELNGCEPLLGTPVAFQIKPVKEGKNRTAENIRPL